MTFLERKLRVSMKGVMRSMLKILIIIIVHLSQGRISHVKMRTHTSKEKFRIPI